MKKIIPIIMIILMTALVFSGCRSIGSKVKEKVEQNNADTNLQDIEELAELDELSDIEELTELEELQELEQMEELAELEELEYLEELAQLEALLEELDEMLTD